jgi:hypothetical protein
VHLFVAAKGGSVAPAQVPSPQAGATFARPQRRTEDAQLTGGTSVVALGVQAPPAAVDAVTLNDEILFESQSVVDGRTHASASPLPLGEPQLRKQTKSS